MPMRIDRRDFLRTAGPAILAGPELAAPRLLTGCCAYSYSTLQRAGKMTMEDVIRKAVELGLDGVDMTREVGLAEC